MPSLTYSKWRLLSSSPADGLPAATIRERQLQALASYIAQSAPPVPAPPAQTSPLPGYAAWYDATKITGTADGTILTSWADQSANAYTLTKPSSFNGGTYYSTTPAKLINGHPCVQFNEGGATFLQNTSFPMTAANVPRLIQAVGQTAVVGYIVGFQMAAGAYPLPPNVWSMWWGADGFVNFGPFDTNLHTFTFYVPPVGQTAYVRLDGTQIGTKAVTDIFGGTGISIGADNDGSSAWRGPIGEVVVYAPSTLTPTQITANEAYLKAKWGTP